MASRIIHTANGGKGVEILSLLNRNQKPRMRHEVHVNFSQEFNNKKDPWIEEQINLLWDTTCQENKRIYNGSKFRFAGISNICGTERIMLNVGLTSYKDLMGTNCHHALGEKLAEYGRQKFGDDNACLSHAFGVGSLLLTKDEKFLFIKRALWTGEDKGKLDRPGGHPEPDNVSEDKKSIDVREEIFNSVLHEIRDEINLPIDTLSDPLLLGIARSLERFGRPSAEFFVRCSLTSQEVEARYLLNTQPEADESVGVIFLQEEQLRNKSLEPNIWQSLTDAACGAIDLYHQCYGCHDCHLP